MIAPDGSQKSIAPGTRPQGSLPQGSLAPETVAKLQAYRVAEARTERIRRWQRIERMILLPVLFIAIVGVFNLKIGQVDGRSMSPTYETGDKLLMLRSYKTFSPLHVGDIVVVRLKHGKYKGEQWVKRVVFIQNKTSTAQWQPTIPTPRNAHVPLDYYFRSYVAGEESVPANNILVMGDNYDNSVDSRDPDIGAIAPDEIEGKVINVWTTEYHNSQAAL